MFQITLNQLIDEMGPYTELPVDGVHLYNLVQYTTIDCSHSGHLKLPLMQQMPLMTLIDMVLVIVTGPWNYAYWFAGIAYWPT